MARRFLAAWRRAVRRLRDLRRPDVQRRPRVAARRREPLREAQVSQKIEEDAAQGGARRRGRDFAGDGLVLRRREGATDPSRTWPGVDAKAFAKVEEPEPAEEPPAEEEDAGETPAEDAPAEEPEGTEGPWAGVVASMGEARDALVTTAHRQLCGRAILRSRYRLLHYESSNRVLAHYDALVAEHRVSWHGTRLGEFG